jgi:plasmid stabilization system protein ParE
MKVIWSIQAKEGLQQTSNYIRKEFGKRSKQKFLDEVLHVASLLERNPYLGQVEPLLDEAPVEYRSIVVNHINKLVYYIHESTIEIVVLWDTRREPKTLLDEVG